MMNSQQTGKGQTHGAAFAKGGLLTIHMEYTCGIGRIVRPTKDLWKTGGYLYQDFARLPFPNITTVQPPPMRQYTFPEESSYPTIDLSQYDRILPFGDSVMEMFTGMREGRLEFFHPNIGKAGGGDHGPIFRPETIDNVMQQIDTKHGKQLRSAIDTNKTEHTALLLGSAAWEIASNTGTLPGYHFEPYLQMYKHLVEKVRQRYPNMPIFWKSPQPTHLTIMNPDNCILNTKNKACNDRIKYISNPTSYHLHREQKRLMTELDVPYLDIWEACYLSPHYHFGSDFQHYTEAMNMLLLDQFYPPSHRLVPPGIGGCNHTLEELRPHAMASHPVKGMVRWIEDEP